MKRAIYLLLLASGLAASQGLFNRGVNLTEWFQAPSPGSIQFTKFSKQDLINIKSLGCDVIRLPINLHAMAGSEPDYALDPLFLSFLDQVVDWAEELQIHLILDNHSFDPFAATDPGIGSILVPVWKQMAEHYKDRSDYLYYEILNEPHGIADNLWNAIQKQVVDSIRTIDKKHIIIIGPANWNSYNNLKAMPVYQDENLIYTFHFYDPILFTHQGASWVTPSLVPLAGVPFPYDAGRMPSLPPSLRGSWLQSAYESYPAEGNVANVEQLIDIAVGFKESRNVTLLCGEFGVYIPNSDQNDRVFWYKTVRSYLESKGIAWATWDYTGSFGLFRQGGYDSFYHDLNVPLVEALGLTAPEQQEYKIRPDSTGFELYSDFVAAGVEASNWISAGRINYYSQEDPFNGSYCLLWTGVDRYNHLGFDLKPNRNLVNLVTKGYALDFWVKGDSPGAQFDVRFIDSKTSQPGDHPWRMRAVINSSIVNWDNQWHHVQIPLKDFQEHGSWDNAWFNPVGAFDWSDVDRFEMAAEYHDMHGKQIWFDDIRIMNPNPTSVAGGETSGPNSFYLEQNFPNPFNPATIIRFHLPRKAHTQLTVYNLKGQLLALLVDQELEGGDHTVPFDATGLAAGLYFYSLKSGGLLLSGKMVVAK